ncbi:MAG: type II secretion system F family protein, partial [Thiohalobacterales bacterium]|nr:type II secretion system F family protein [Thiohalobacterales bacterium]
PLRRRLHVASGQPGGTATLSSRLNQAMEPLTPYVMPKKDWERNRISERLVQAGFRSESALTTFHLIKAMLTILLPLATVLLAPLFPHATLNQVIIASAFAGFIGLTVPNMVLERMKLNRMKRIRHGFPDALDLLVVCSEAGLGLNAAIERVAQELEATHPDLAEELGLVNAETRVGVNRLDALRNLAQRTGLEDIRGLVALLTQSLRLGSGVADTLRIYSEEFRDKRMQKAEELAAKIGTKMIFPLVTCLFPGFFAVVIGPAALKIIAAFSQASF